MEEERELEVVVKFRYKVKASQLKEGYGTMDWEDVPAIDRELLHDPANLVGQLEDTLYSVSVKYV